MAIITCPECGKEFSDSAEKCPNCGISINDVKAKIHQLRMNTDEKYRAEVDSNQRKITKGSCIFISIIFVACLILYFAVSGGGGGGGGSDYCDTLRSNYTSASSRGDYDKALEYFNKAASLGCDW